MYNKLYKFCEENNYVLLECLEYGRYGDGNVSVTELLSLIIDPTFEFIKENCADALDKACKRGLDVHSHLEGNSKGHEPLVISMMDKEHYLYKYRRIHRQWELLHGVTIKEREKTFYRGALRGTIDVILEGGIVVDYKTSLFNNVKYNLQIAAYCLLSGCNKGFILYMNEKKFIYNEIKDINNYIDIFLELLDYSKTIGNFNINKTGTMIH